MMSRRSPILCFVALLIAFATVSGLVVDSDISPNHAQRQKRRRLPLGHLPEPALQWETRLPGAGTEDRYVAIMAR